MDITLEIFDAPTSGNSVWGPYTWPNVSVYNGIFAVSLGAGGSPPLTSAQLTTSALWAKWSMASVELSPRQHIQSVPYALVARDSTQLGGSPASSYVKTTSLAAVALTGDYNDLSNTPPLAAVALSGDYGDLSGAPALAPVATSGQYSDLSGKPNLAAVATSGQYADLSGKPNLAAVATSGQYADLVAAPMSLDAAGNAVVAQGLKVGSATTCGTSQEGLLRWNATAKVIDVCDGSIWKTIGSGGAGSGNLGTLNNPATSCQALHAANNSLASGAYWIDPDGEGPIQRHYIYCEMSLNGGGWTLVAKSNAIDNNHIGASAASPEFLTSLSTTSSGYVGDAFRLALGSCYRVTSGGITKFARVTNTRSFATWWGNPNIGVLWADTYGTTVGHYTTSAADDAGGAGTSAGPAYAGRNWARPNGYVGSGLFAGGTYGWDGYILVKECIQ